MVRVSIFTGQAGLQGFLTVPGAEADEWLDAGQCTDCFQPAFNYRNGGAAQYIMALGNFDEPGKAPRRFRMGFMSSSDNHYGRPGTGYKEVHRRGMTESTGNLRAGSDSRCASTRPARAKNPIFSCLSRARSPISRISSDRRPHSLRSRNVCSSNIAAPVLLGSASIAAANSLSLS